MRDQRPEEIVEFQRFTARTAAFTNLQILEEEEKRVNGHKHKSHVMETAGNYGFALPAGSVCRSIWFSCIAHFALVIMV